MLCLIHFSNYIQNHKSKFDKHTPSPKVWENILYQLEGSTSSKPSTAKHIRLSPYWKVAATVLLALSIGWFNWSDFITMDDVKLVIENRRECRKFCPSSRTKTRNRGNRIIL